MLLSYVLENCECIHEKINYQDQIGNTAFHLVVKANTANVDICENILVLLLKSNCNSSLMDATSKRPVDYVREGSRLFHLLTEKSNPGIHFSYVEVESLSRHDVLAIGTYLKDNYKYHKK